MAVLVTCLELTVAVAIEDDVCWVFDTLLWREGGLLGAAASLHRTEVFEYYSSRVILDYKGHSVKL